MNSSLRRYMSLAILCVSGTGFVSCLGTPPLKTAHLEIRTRDGKVVPLTAEIARSAGEQEKGFMERKSIPDGTGMIFVYPSDRQMFFWMKNTPHPLSIAYIDSSGTIREIYELVPYSLETVASIRSLRYALEVPSLWFERAGISIGDQLTEESLAALNP